MKIEQLKVTVDAETTLYFLTRSGEETVGVLRLSPDGYVWSLFVAEAHRKAGIGAALVEAACAWCREAGLETIGLSVKDDNDGARQLYQRLGFRKYIPSNSEGYTQFVKLLTP